MLYRIVMFLTLFMCATTSFAACWQGTGGGGGPIILNADFGTIDVPKNLPVGGAIATLHLGTTVTHVVECDGASPYYYDSGEMEYSTVKTSTSHAYPTNVRGIGIRISNSMLYFDPKGPDQAFIKESNIGDGISSEPVTVELIKTDTVVSGDDLQQGLMAEYYVTDSGFNRLATMTQIYMGPGGSIVAGTCTAISNTLNFDMGSIGTDSFAEPVGSTSSKTVTQNLDLNCDVGTNISLTLNGTQNPDTSDTSVVKLDNQGSPGVASGVGIQVLYNNAPIKLNEKLTLKTSSDAVEAFPITVRYYKTKSSIGSGIANAILTLDMTYQ